MYSTGSFEYFWNRWRPFTWSVYLGHLFPVGKRIGKSFSSLLNVKLFKMCQHLKQGAGFGIISGLAVMLWIGVGSQVAKAHGFLKLVPKPYSIEHCPALNLTSIVLDAATQAEQLVSP